MTSEQDRHNGRSSRLEDIVRTLEPVKSLPPELQRRIIDESSIVTRARDSIIFRQGDNDNHVFYLLEGQLQLLCDGEVMKTVTGGTDEARYRLSQLRPRRMTAVAITEVILFKTERSLIQTLMEQCEGQLPAEIEVSELTDDSHVDWMSKLLNTPLFCRIPAANIQQVFSRMETLRADPEQVIIRQGEEGDAYYIIKTGRCRVSRHARPGERELTLAELGPGDCFGEEALISGSARSASVSMISSGELMRLGGEHFEDLLIKPALRSLRWGEAVRQVEQGASWIQVDMQAGDPARLSGEVFHIPLPQLRTHFRELDAAGTYVTCCEDGRYSAVAAFILMNMGFEVYYLQGGIKAYEIEGDDSGELEPPEEVDTSVGQDPLFSAMHLKHELDQAREKMQQELENKLEQERRRIDQQSERARKMLDEARALKSEMEKNRQQAETLATASERRLAEKVKEIELKAEQRIEQERQRLKQLSRKNAQEIAEIRRLKQLAEERLAEERLVMTTQVRENQKELEGILRMKPQQPAGQDAFNQAREQRQLDNIKREEALQAKVRSMLLAERERMEKEFTSSRELLREALQESRVAEAIRMARGKEVEQIIEEFKLEHKKALKAQQESLREQRHKLELEASRIQQVIFAARQASREAGMEMQSAEHELHRLRITRGILLDENSSMAVQDKVDRELVRAQDRVAESSYQVRTARRAHGDAERAQRENRKKLDEQQQAEKRLATKIEDNLQSWIAEQRSFACNEEQLRLQQEQEQKINDMLKRAEKLREEEQARNARLLEELTSHTDNKGH